MWHLPKDRLVVTKRRNENQRFKLISHNLLSNKISVHLHGFHKKNRYKHLYLAIVFSVIQLYFSTFLGDLCSIDPLPLSKLGCDC